MGAPDFPGNDFHSTFLKDFEPKLTSAEPKSGASRRPRTHISTHLLDLATAQSFTKRGAAGRLTGSPIGSARVPCALSICPYAIGLGCLSVYLSVCLSVCQSSYPGACVLSPGSIGGSLPVPKTESTSAARLIYDRHQRFPSFWRLPPFYCFQAFVGFSVTLDRV